MSQVAQRAARIEEALKQLEAVTLVICAGGHGYPASLTGVFGEDRHAAAAVRRWYAEHADSPLKPEHAKLMRRYRLTLPRRAPAATQGPQEGTR